MYLLGLVLIASTVNHGELTLHLAAPLDLAPAFPLSLLFLLPLPPALHALAHIQHALCSSPIYCS